MCAVALTASFFAVAAGCVTASRTNSSDKNKFAGILNSDTPTQKPGITAELIKILPETIEKGTQFPDTEIGKRLVRMTGRSLTSKDINTLVAIRALLLAQRELRDKRPVQTRELSKIILSMEHLGTQFYASALRYLAMADILALSSSAAPVAELQGARHPTNEFNALQTLQCQAACTTHGWQILSFEDANLFSAAGYQSRLLSDTNLKAENLEKPPWLKSIFANSLPTPRPDRLEELQSLSPISPKYRLQKLKILVEEKKWTLAANFAKTVLKDARLPVPPKKLNNQCPADALYAQYALAQATRIAQDRKTFAQLQEQLVGHLDNSNCTHDSFEFEKEQFDTFRLDARLWLARLQWELNRNADAFRSARQVLADAARLQSWEHYFDASKVMIGRVGFEMLSTADNIRLLEGLEKIPSTTESEEFFVWLHSRRGLMHFLNGEFDKSQKSFERIIEFTSDSPTRSMAFYWIGRAHQAAKKTAEGENAFLSSGATDPLSIYDIFSGQLLSRESGRASTQVKQAFYSDWKTELESWLQIDEAKPLKIVSSVPPRSSTTITPNPEHQKVVNSQKQFDNSLESAILLLTLTKATAPQLTSDEFSHYMGNSDDLIPSYVRGEVQYLRQSFKRLNTLHTEVLPRAHQIAWLTHVLGDHANSILFVGRLRDMLGWDTDYLPFLYFIFYPRPYLQEFSRAAEKCAVDVDLLYAVARQESLFQTSIKSHVGAVGLMQLLPSTAKKVLRDLPEYSMQEKIDLTSPATNTIAGACYLKQLLQRYNNNLTFAIAAYNAGEAAVDKWVSNRQKLEDIPFFIEFIPYAETKNYVQKVLRNYYNIKWIYR
jgi:hypothetical protein